MNFTYEYKSKTIFSDGLWKDQNIKGNEKYILIYLIGHFNPKEGYAFPSINTISTECGLNKRTVIKVLGVLEEKGYIKKVQSPKIKTDKGIQYQNNKYYIKCTGYMFYKNKEVSDSPLEEQSQLDNSNDEYYTPNGNVEGQMDISDYDLASEESTSDNEVNTMYDSYKEIYELALINGINSILSPTSRFGLTEYAKAHGLVIPV